MLRFECDYSEGAHPKILERLLETNLEQTPGYGKDEHCERAKTLIRQACGLPQSTIEFVTGGTQANQIVIAAILKPYQGVVCADTGHINTHETGATHPDGLPAFHGLGYRYDTDRYTRARMVFLKTSPSSSV